MFSNIISTIRTQIAHLTARQLSVFEVSIVFLLCSITFVVVYTLHTKEILDPETPQSVRETPTIVMPINPSRESTLDQKRTELNEIESNLMLSDTQYERLAYTLQKAFSLITTNNRAPSLDEVELAEARTLFNQVYGDTKNKPSQKLLTEKALWGYLFYFVSTGYLPDVIDDMPSDIRNAYFSEWNSPEVFSEDVFQKRKKIFEGMIAFIDDENLFSELKNEKSFNAYSAVVKAVYLDSFKEGLSSDEISSVVTSLNTDLTQYEQGFMTDDLPPTSLRLAVVVPSHISFARYVLDTIQQPGASRTQFFYPLTTYIEEQKDTDAFGREIVLSRIRLYELSAGVRENTSENQIAETVQRLTAQLSQNPDLQPIMKRIITYSLNESEQWNAVHRDLTELQKNSSSFKAFLSSLNIES